jgi:imidazolonepropionase-like amidohydrolase
LSTLFGRSTLALVALCLSAGRSGAQLGVQARRSVPATYAITNARIVSAPGQVIDRGTVVIRNGLIAAVGPAVAVPGDARSIDGTGLTVYPGFIDAYSNVGYEAQPATPQGGRGAGGAQPARVDAAPNSLNRAGLQPEV